MPSVVRDLAALNKREMLPWDYWGIARTLRPEVVLTEVTASHIDGLATLIAGADPDWKVLRDTYDREDALRVPRVVMDNPLGGITRGWEEIRAVYERIFGGRPSVRVEFYDYTIHEAGEMGYAVGRERGELRRGDDVLSLAIRTTRVYRRMDGRWRRVHHRGSMDDAGMLARYQRAVGVGPA
jgi:ketosteroid isomerase-like protein